MGRMPGFFRKVNGQNKWPCWRTGPGSRAAQPAAGGEGRQVGGTGGPAPARQARRVAGDLVMVKTRPLTKDSNHNEWLSVRKTTGQQPNRATRPGAA